MANADSRAMLRDGFPGQRMLVLPRPLVRVALTQEPTAQMLVTDAGYFPHALHHGRVRDVAIDQAVVLVCVKGRGWCRTPDGLFEVRAGQVVIVPPGLPHAYGGDNDDPWTLWWIHLAGLAVPSLVSAAGASSVSPVREPSDVYGAALLASEIVQWMELDSTSPSLLAASGAAWHLMSLLASSRTPSTASHEAVERAAAYLREHLNSHSSVSELAAMAGLSSSHFAALFKKRLGVPVAQYQTQVRMSRARELLDTTNFAIADVAGRVGYEDAFYFGRQFRKIHGVSPSSYRRQKKG